MESTTSPSLESYDSYPRIEEAFQAYLDESLNPRGPDLLYEIVGSLGLPPEASVLDLGCGEGRHSIRLAQQFRFAVRGIDPVPRNMEVANQGLDEAAKRDPALSKLVRFELGAAESLSVGDASVDLVWCRNVLVLVGPLDKAFAECRRVLRTGGHMLIYDTLRTDRLEPREGDWLSASLGMGGPANAHQHIEAAFAGAGFEIEQSIELGSEWGEYEQEGTGNPGRRLLHAARLLRAPERYVAKFGQTNYDIMLGDCFWHVYRMTGKLSSRVYLLRAP